MKKGTALWRDENIDHVVADHALLVAQHIGFDESPDP
jgi:hypothetical protein